MVGAAGAVDADRAAEFRHHQHGRLVPGCTQCCFQCQDADVQLFQGADEPLLLAGMGIPAAAFQHRHPWAIRGREQASGGAGDVGDRVPVAGGCHPGQHATGEATVFQPFRQDRPEEGVVMGEVGDPGIEVWGQRLVAGGGIGAHARRAAQHQRHRHAHRERGVRALCRHRLDGAVQPAAGEPLFGAAFHVVLRVEVAAASVWAGHRVHGQQLAGGVEAVHAFQRGVEAEEAAHIQESAGFAWFRQDQGPAQAGKRRVAVGGYGGEAIQGAAEDDDHQALFGRRIRQGDRGAADGPGGGEAQEGRAAGDLHRQRLWNSGEVSSSVIASRRDPAPRRASRVRGCRRGPRDASATSIGSRSARPAML